MSKKPPSAFAALSSPTAVVPKPGVAETTQTNPEPVSKAQSTDWRSTRKQVPVYLTPATWKQLRRLSVDLETSMNALLLDGLDRLFKEHGLKSSGDLG